MKDIFLFDFDRTITNEDTTHELLKTHNPEWLKINRQLYKEGKLNILQYVENGLGSLNISKEMYKSTLQDKVTIDETFKHFVDSGLLFNIVSAGTKFHVQAVLEKYKIYLDEKKIISNDITFKENQIKITHPYLDPERQNGVDKAGTIEKYRKEGYRTIFVGDGPSDYASAKVADIVFAKKGTRLVNFCEENNLFFYMFNDFDELLDIYKNEILQS